jgi:hypothetical protein
MAHHPPLYPSNGAQQFRDCCLGRLESMLENFAAKTRPVAWTFLPFIERKCHKGGSDQILCRTQSGRRDETCTNNYANTVIANNLWRVLGMPFPACQSVRYSVVATGGGMAPPVVGCGNGLEVQRDHVRRSKELRGII